MCFWSKTQTSHLNCLNKGYSTGLVSHFLRHQLRDAVLSPEFVLKDSTSLIYQLECSSIHGHLSGTRCNPNISRCCSAEHFTPLLMTSMGLQHCKNQIVQFCCKFFMQVPNIQKKDFMIQHSIKLQLGSIIDFCAGSKCSWIRVEVLPGNCLPLWYYQLQTGQILQFVHLVRILGHCVLEICFNLRQVGEFIPSTL